MRDYLRENDKYTTRLVTNSAVDVETGIIIVIQFELLYCTLLIVVVYVCLCV